MTKFGWSVLLNVVSTVGIKINNTTNSRRGISENLNGLLNNVQKQMKETKMLLRILKNWTSLKANQQLLHPHQQHLLLLPPFVVRRATHHKPVGIHFKNARAAARCNTATKSANERIGVQGGTNKNAND